MLLNFIIRKMKAIPLRINQIMLIKFYSTILMMEIRGFLILLYSYLRYYYYGCVYNQIIRKCYLKFNIYYKYVYF